MENSIEQKYERYAELKVEEKRIKTEIEALKGFLTHDMMERTDGEKGELPLEVGTFSLSLKRKYTYPQEVVVAEESYKKLKKTAEQTGTATYEENPVLSFYAN